MTKTVHHLMICAPAMAGLAGFVTSAKFICLYGWVLLLFYKLFSQAFGFVPYSGL